MNTKEKLIIGVTERGDPSINYEWVRKMNSVDGAVIITKNLTPKFQEAILPFADKCILHASITGLGGTAMEPNLPKWQDSLLQLTNLVKAGFPKDHIVVRVDPIIPYWDYLERAEQVIISAYHCGFRRFRISVMDHYGHVFVRFSEADIPYPLPAQKSEYGRSFRASEAQMQEVSDVCRRLKERHPDIVIEACAEKSLRHVRHCGCVSAYDFQILGLPYDDIDAPGYQRMGCMCYSGKKELLTDKARCPYQCLYCFWKDMPVDAEADNHERK